MKQTILTGLRKFFNREPKTIQKKINKIKNPLPDSYRALMDKYAQAIIGDDIDLALELYRKLKDMDEQLNLYNYSKNGNRYLKKYSR